MIIGCWPLCSMQSSLLKPIHVHAGNKDPVKIINNRAFWVQLEVLLAILKPFTLVVKAIQSRTALLADVFRYFIYLGFTLSSMLASLPRSFAEHCCAAFNKRYAEIVSPICHLALFLHPKYREAAGQIPLKQLATSVRHAWSLPACICWPK